MKWEGAGASDGRGGGNRIGGGSEGGARWRCLPVYGRGLEGEFGRSAVE